MGGDRREVQKEDSGSQAEDKIVIIDCHPICYEAMHHFGGLQWEDRYTGVIFHFLNRLLSFVNRFNTTKFVFAWDSRKSKRKELYPDYKNKVLPERSPEDEALWAHCFEQMYQLRKHILPDLGFKNVFIKTGYEADDIIAGVVIYGDSADYIVVSSDNDLYQLLGYCRMFILKSKKFYTGEDFVKDYNILPEQWARVKTYAGCAGDMVPGLSGIGHKRAIAYINGELKDKFFNVIKFADKEILDRNRRLVTLPFNNNSFPTLKLDFDENFDLDNIFSICENYGMFTLLKGSRLQAWKELAR